MRFAGLCLISIIVVGVAPAGNAAAASPAWLLCLEGKEGSTPTKYTTNQCTKAASENKGKWEPVELAAGKTDTVKLSPGTIRLTDLDVGLGKEKLTLVCTHGESFNTLQSPKVLIIQSFKIGGSVSDCEPSTLCERGKIEKFESGDLPWKSEIFETEKRIIGKLESDGAGEPFVSFTCHSPFGSLSDTCQTSTGKPEELGLENKTSGESLSILTEFLKTVKWSCSLGSKESGEIEGQPMLSLSNGNGLSINSNGKITAVCNVRKEKWVFCSEGRETNTQVVKAANGNPTVLDSKIKGVEVEIKCTGGGFEPKLESGRSLSGTDKLESCTVPKPAGTCTISGDTIKSELIGGLGGVLTSPPEVELEGNFSNIIEKLRVAKFKIEGCAAIEGEYTLRGKQKCKVDSTYETEQTEHEFKCEKTGSELKLESETATLSMTAKGPLIGGGNWSMQLN